MAKKQTRRSISVSRGTYERLKAYCETNQISMSQFVEHRVGDFLGRAPSTPACAQPASAASIIAKAAPEKTATAAKMDIGRTDTAKAVKQGTAMDTAALHKAAPLVQAFSEVVLPSQPAKSTSQSSVAKETIQAKTATSVRTTPKPRPIDMNQPLSQAVSLPKSIPARPSNEPVPKDPDSQLTAEQIFTF